MPEHTIILRRCGRALVVISALDIAATIWSHVIGWSYESMFSIPALIGGLFLIRGNLRTARWTSAICALVLASFGFAFLGTPLVLPVGYCFAALRHADGIAVDVVLVAVFFSALFWTLRQTSHAAVLQAQRDARLPPPRIRSAFIAGAVFSLTLVTVMAVMTRTDSAREAILRAEQQLGGGFRYCVTSIKISKGSDGKTVRAVVAAYNASELRSVEIARRD